MSTVLVTGAVGGMGRAIVADLTPDYEVIALARDDERLDALVADTGAIPWAGDLTDHSWLAERVAGLERLDAVVHAAAVAGNLAPADARPNDFRHQLEINVIAPAELTRLCLPLLRAARGTVVFIGSGASTRVRAGSVVYPVTKHALKAYADGVRLDESRHGVRVSSLYPGPTDTQMYERTAPTAYDPGHLITVASMARAVRFVLEAGADVQITDLAVRPRQELG